MASLRQSPNGQPPGPLHSPGGQAPGLFQLPPGLQHRTATPPEGPPSLNSMQIALMALKVPVPVPITGICPPYSIIFLKKTAYEVVKNVKSSSVAYFADVV